MAVGGRTCQSWSRAALMDSFSITLDNLINLDNCQEASTAQLDISSKTHLKMAL